MSDTYLIVLAKNANFLHDIKKLVQFEKSYYEVDKYWVEILAYLKTYLAKKLPDNLEFRATLICKSD